MKLLYAIVPVFIILVFSEAWWRKRGLHGEFSRKFVHITVGSFVAFWPYFLTWDQIRLLSVAFFIVVLISKQLQAIHSVQRPTWGELFFAIAVGATTFITHNDAIYAAAILLMSLADGFAAVVGTRYGASKRYSIFGHAKSVVGTVTFAIVALIILVSFNIAAKWSLPYLGLLAVAILASSIENLGVNGLDNLFVPILAAIILTQLH
jgi:phytol kinase